MEPLAAEITSQRFARRFFGVDPKAVHQFLEEIAEALSRLYEKNARLTIERNDAQTALKAARDQVEAAAQQATALQARVRRYEEREALIAHTLELVQETRESTLTRAEAEAEKTVATALVDAKQIVQSSRETAAEVLREVQRRALQTLESAKHAAEAKVALAGAESRLLVEESHAVAARIDLLTKQQLATLLTQIEAMLAECDAARNRRQCPNKLDDLRAELNAIKTRVSDFEGELTHKSRES